MHGRMLSVAEIDEMMQDITSEEHVKYILNMATEGLNQQKGQLEAAPSAAPAPASAPEEEEEADEEIDYGQKFNDYKSEFDKNVAAFKKALTDGNPASFFESEEFTKLKTQFDSDQEKLKVKAERALTRTATGLATLEPVVGASKGLNDFATDQVKQVDKSLEKLVQHMRAESAKIDAELEKARVYVRNDLWEKGNRDVSKKEELELKGITPRATKKEAEVTSHTLDGGCCQGGGRGREGREGA